MQNLLSVRIFSQNDNSFKDIDKITRDYYFIAVKNRQYCKKSERANPRDRNSEFDSQIIKKNKTSLTENIKKMLSMHAKGMTTNAISAHIEDICCFEVSESLISRITEKILPVVK